MSSKHVVLFGAGMIGKIACEYYRDKVNFECFVDNSQEKWGTLFCGLEVKPPQILENTDAEIWITTVHYQDIEKEVLKKYGIKKVIVFGVGLQEVQMVDEESIFGRCINISKFLREATINHRTITLAKQSMNWGGAGILDYCLLRALIIRYSLKTYLEIGTYIGDSLCVVSDLVERCYSITVPESHPAHMSHWRRERRLIDYSNQLVTEKNMIQYLSDSKEFDFSSIREKIDMFFIDGDHRFEGVLSDSKNVYDICDKENSFIIWHDCRTDTGLDSAVLGAIKQAIGEQFETNFYIFDNCMCGIYIPDKYKKDFALITEEDELVTYKIDVEINESHLM